jgi:cysteine desulfurase/selenocysteine lyase
VTESGELNLTNIDDILKDAKLVAVTQMSNVLGTVNDVKMLAQKAHAVGAKILVDGAQSVPHMPVDVQNLDCDFLVFSGHKMVGPTGIGVLYAKEAVLETMEPYQRGGDMILEVTKEAATWNELPYKFEAGTPNIAGAIGLGAAAEYLSSVGMDQVWQHDQELAAYGMAKLAIVPGVKVLGTSTVRGAIFALDIAGVHPHDIGSILDEQHIAVRAGHHCAQPLHQRFGLVATARASCYLYTTKADIDRLIIGIQKVQEVFA